MEIEQLNLFYEIKEEVVDDDNSRICIECNEQKPLELFPIDSQAYKGRKHTCRECKNKHSLIIKLYKDKHRHPNENYECPICGKKQDGISRAGHSWNVDHCHITGKVRGYLCHRCNTGMGLLRDDTNLLTKAIEWLNKGEE